MHPATSLDDISAHVRGDSYDDPRSVLLIFSPFSHDPASENAAFLARVVDYHYQSDRNTPCYCIGYSVYEPGPDKRFSHGVNLRDIPGTGGLVSYFYPDLFHQARAELQRRLHGQWQYDGGTDLLLFAVGADRRVLWDHAALACSSRLVGPGRAFASVEQMVRNILNLNEAAKGRLVPDELSPTLARRQFAARLRQFAPQLLLTLIGR